jgi:hypothetical protein
MNANNQEPVDANGETAANSPSKSRQVARWLGKASCSLLGLLMILSFAGSISAGRVGNLNLQHLARIDIDDNEKVRLNTCNSLLRDTAGLKGSGDNESAGLQKLDDAAATYRQTYDKEIFRAYWGTPGTDTTKWGNGLWEYDRQTSKIAEQRAIDGESLDKMTTALATLEQECRPNAS